MRTQYHTMPAQFNSLCMVCGKDILEGELLTVARTGSKHVVTHALCSGEHAVAIEPPQPPSEAARIEDALEFAFNYGTVDGDHHKMWVIDQMVRALTGDDYEAWVAAAEDGGFVWDTGTAWHLPKESS